MAILKESSLLAVICLTVMFGSAFFATMIRSYDQVPELKEQIQTLTEELQACDNNQET